MRLLPLAIGVLGTLLWDATAAEPAWRTAPLPPEAERLNRTLTTEWAYSRVWSTNTDRAEALPSWLTHYNLERPHLGIGGLRPIDRVNNATGQYS